MKDDFEKDEEFDPTQSEEFLKNLELALNPTEEEQEKWEPKVEEDSPWISIDDSVQSDSTAETEEENNTEEQINSESKETGETASEESEQSAQADETEPTLSEEEENNQDTELPVLDISEELFQVNQEETEFQEKEPADEVLLGINAALAEQIEQEFGKSVYEEEKKPGKLKAFFSGMPKWSIILITILFVLILSFGLLFGTSAGRGVVSRIVVEILFGGVNQPDPEDDILITLTPEPTEPVDPNVTPVPTEAVPTVAVPTGAVVEDDSVINILLLGEENIYGTSRGRTDAILVVSLDKDGGPIKLISFMRDLYVKIPGYNDNKLNAAYAFGGAKLMMETIETNFKIKLDGYVLVNFSGFEDIIDELGGLEISLTVRESNYLNTTKYISKVEERNTVPGLQKLTGSQVLGFCRIRKVPAANGKDSDFGRTYRQRLVLEKLFEKYKEKNYTELLSVMYKCLGYVTAPDSLKEIAAECLQVVIENKMFDLETMQMPVNGHFENIIINGNDVITYFPDNNTLLHDFIYQNEE